MHVLMHGVVNRLVRVSPGFFTGVKGASFQGGSRIFPYKFILRYCIYTIQVHDDLWFFNPQKEGKQTHLPFGLKRY
jgi:hypothetical protein